MPTVHLLIKGKVQGVFYRASAKETADRTGVTGWVKNTPEGDVEAMATGTEKQLQQFISWCKKGPSSAKVRDVIVTEEDETVFNDFVIKR